ncbi:hypothetical protein BDA96_04G237900 [Sorghum bicolor]|uniref:Uncharacterized protein n=1 Tax=Sorghum bicolor TaxID=4558 RepID=A0A921UK21_SORBI|nr:hypothetical protein BDA96_04G237900 [Sorghum bicolor]
MLLTPSSTPRRRRCRVPSGERRTLLLIGRRRVGSLQSVEQAEQAERGLLHCSPRARDLLLSPPWLPARAPG